MTAFDDLTAEIAFTTDFDAGTPSWTDVTPYLLSAETERGRTSPVDVCDPGTATLWFDNTDGRWDPDRTSGPYYGHLRPNKLIRLSVTVGATTYRLFTGYIDSLEESWPGGAQKSVCEVRATDRFKELARTTITTTRVSETADTRITALLASVPFKTINTDGYSARTVIGLEYERDDILLAAQDAARSDGGMLFVDSSGTVVFQTSTFRQTNTRSTTSQATFGNHGSAVGVEADLLRSVDMSLMANTVRLTDGHGVQHSISDTVAAGIDGSIEVDLGSTLLDISSQGDDRVTEVLNLLIDAKPRWRSLTIDPLTDADALTQAVTREISDRVTVAFIHPGLSTGTSRAQFVESVKHVIKRMPEPQWLTTFGLSGLPGAASEGRVALP